MFLSLYVLLSYYPIGFNSSFKVFLPERSLELKFRISKSLINLCYFAPADVFLSNQSLVLGRIDPNLFPSGFLLQFQGHALNARRPRTGLTLAAQGVSAQRLLCPRLLESVKRSLWAETP